MVAFEPGIVKLVSTLESTMGQQQAQLKLPGNCTSAAFCKATSKMAVGGTSVVLLPNTLLTKLTQHQWLSTSIHLTDTAPLQMLAAAAALIFICTKRILLMLCAS